MSDKLHTRKLVVPVATIHTLVVLATVVATVAAPLKWLPMRP